MRLFYLFFFVSHFLNNAPDEFKRHFFVLFSSARKRLIPLNLLTKSEYVYEAEGRVDKLFAFKNLHLQT